MASIPNRRYYMTFYAYPNRLMCDCLEECRKLLKANNPNSIHRCMPGLIEEIQTYGNRMEAALSDQSDIKRAHEEIKKLKKEIKTLEAKRDELTGDNE